jgi:methanogenic corrinoid protein MtbC1
MTFDTEEFRAHYDVMFSYVMKQVPKYEVLYHATDLIGTHALEFYLRYHIDTLVTLIEAEEFKNIERGLRWYYRYLHYAGVDGALHERYYNLWQIAVNRNLPARDALLWNKVFVHLKEHYAIWTEQALEIDDPLETAPREAAALYRHLLSGRRDDAARLLHQLLEQFGTVGRLYRHIVEPVMVRVGIGWEQGEVSVAKEHLATSIIQEIIPDLSDTLLNEHFQPRVLVSTPPKELHNVGAVMLTQHLNASGVRTMLLDAETPSATIVRQVQLIPSIEVVAFSSALVTNLNAIKQMIYELKTCCPNRGLIFMVGGQLFKQFPELLSYISANALAESAEEAETLIKAWLGSQTGS